MGIQKIQSKRDYQINYMPSSLQRNIHIDTHRFKVLNCGRRYGKTFWLIAECNIIAMEVAKKEKRKARIWIVAPTYPLVKEAWRVANELLKNAILDKRETDLWLSLPWAEFEFKSAEHGDEGLRGAGLDGLGVDEASRVKGQAWEYGLRPALSDRQGRAVFISTPRGQNWFYDLYLQGQKPNPEIKSWHYTTMDGWRSLYGGDERKLKEMEKEWDTIQSTTPEMIFKQEYLAEFLEDESTVFHGLNKCIKGSFELPIEGENYVIGVDLAKTQDFSVITVLKLYDNQVVHSERFKDVSWEIQKRRIMNVHQRYNKGKVVVDSTGVGDPIVEDLSRMGLWIQGYKFGSVTKQELVEELMVVIEQGAIGIPKEAENLLYELRTFEYELLPTTGRIRYSAPEGKFDDEVISLGLAVMGAKHQIFNRRPKEKVEDTRESIYRSLVTRPSSMDFLRSHPNLVALGVDRRGVKKMFSLRGR